MTDEVKEKDPISIIRFERKIEPLVKKEKTNEKIFYCK